MKSMTAIGRAAGTVCDKDAALELRAVNSKHLDIFLRLPRELSAVEDRIKPLLQSLGVLRGKVDLTVTLSGGREATPQPDPKAVAEYVAMLRKLRDAFYLADDISVMQIASNKDLFRSSAELPDADALWAELSPLLEAATADFLARREAEGARLLTDMRSKLSEVEAALTKIEALSADTVTHYRERLTARVREAMADSGLAPDEARLLSECAVFADRIAIDEEIVRLRSHLKSFEEMAAGEAAGRKLDFLLQEMNREANTMGAKCADAAVAVLVVEIKCILEKIREQVQNIE